MHSLSIDDFHNSREERYLEQDQAIGYLRDSFDYATIFGCVLQPLRLERQLDRTVRMRDWQRNVERHVRIVISPPAVVIVEGVFLFQAQCRDLFDLRVWLDISFEAALGRALKRPPDTAYYQDAQTIERKYRNRFLPGQRLHLERDQPRAHAHVVIPQET